MSKREEKPRKEKRKSFLLRLDPALHDDLRRWAESEFRSLNAQIEYLLREALRRRSSLDEGVSGKRLGKSPKDSS